MCVKKVKRKANFYILLAAHTAGGTSLHRNPTLASDLHLCPRTFCPVRDRTRKQLHVYTGDSRPHALGASSSLHICIQRPVFQQEYSNKMKIFQKTKNILNPSDRIYISAFKSAIFSLRFWARANLDARGDKQQPVVTRILEDLKVGGDRCEILCWRDRASQFGGWLCQRPGSPGVPVEQPGQVCHGCC